MSAGATRLGRPTPRRWWPRLAWGRRAGATLYWVAVEPASFQRGLCVGSQGREGPFERPPWSSLANVNLLW